MEEAERPRRLAPVIAGAAAYAVLATVVAERLIRDGGGEGAWFALWVLAPALLLGVAGRVVYLGPLVPWLALVALGAADRGRMDGWESLWFFNLALLGGVHIVLLAAMRALHRRSVS